MTTVLLVDDEALTREILRDYLSSDPTIEIVGEASNGKSAVVQAASLQPEVILMDMQMPVMDGVAATAQIHQSNPEIAILGLSTFATDRYVVDLLRAGASGYIVKDAKPQEITDAINKVAAGESILSPQVARHVVSGLANSIPAEVEADAELIDALTDKELEVIKLLGRGMSNKEMATELFVTESTIKARFVKVMEKFGVRDRVQILVKAVEHGLLDMKPGSRAR
ncbi:DNA-binding response regulator [Arthrobacter sp. MYb211]|uniref:response regulator n=1 Tax=Micrococcaceae TaxID=1268 RepID=UPI000BB6B7A7|nr:MULTISPECIES: response regulator transcription factor [Micrococcaceae]PCC28753.1 DNA-binding response regulator [Glutamicibacter sp. BW80]PRA02968.1 DNA-binding response regulator [Arthrobacter sp. MYb229]PRA11070.1 DNA-binding response regulator [Arthrobacter sp. MYb221]PRB49438.1 DNA-binding response regulator [Arthrobacter sp. MYb216]PRC07224.1 DNA-binding response regulator [Arthrobacter sp. MYb211]